MNINDYKYKVELHAHTSPMSPCADFTPQEVIERYAAIGFSAVAITNHFCQYSFGNVSKEKVLSRFLTDYENAKSAAEKHGMKALLGMEIRFPENNNDYLIFGINEDEIDRLYELTKTDYISFYKEFKNAKNVIIQAHPFRDGMVLADPEYLDGIETFNMHPNHNAKISLAVQCAKKHPHFITTCGTDFHHNSHEGLGGILSKTVPNDSIELAALLKSRDYLFNVGGSIVIP